MQILAEGTKGLLQRYLIGSTPGSNPSKIVKEGANRSKSRTKK